MDECCFVEVHKLQFAQVRLPDAWPAPAMSEWTSNPNPERGGAGAVRLRAKLDDGSKSNADTLNARVETLLQKLRPGGGNVSGLLNCLCGALCPRHTHTVAIGTHVTLCACRKHSQLCTSRTLRCAVLHGSTLPLGCACGEPHAQRGVVSARGSCCGSHQILIVEQPSLSVSLCVPVSVQSNPGAALSQPAQMWQ